MVAPAAALEGCLHTRRVEAGAGAIGEPGPPTTDTLVEGRVEQRLDPAVAVSDDREARSP